MHRFVQNPPWATRVLTSSWQTMSEHVKKAWLPVIDTVEYETRGKLSGEIHEYGCGQYGCVFPTHDDDVVLKITADSTEAEFAATLAPTISEPICVRYHAVMRLGGKFKDATEKTTLYLLWRESARHVGDVQAMGELASRLINHQHAAAQKAYQAIANQEDPRLIDDYIQHWLAACARMANDPAVASLGRGMAANFRQHNILFGDVHAGNVGVVVRNGSDMWVITDPGHVAVVNYDPEENIQTLRQGSATRKIAQITTRRSSR